MRRSYKRSKLKLNSCESGVTSEIKVDLSHQFDKISQKMNADLEQILDAHKENSDLRGEQYEGIFREFLESYLPKKLDVSTGTIVDSEGRQSKQ